MPRFFFNVIDDVIATDEEGQELPNLESALAEGARGARSLASEQVLQGRLSLHHRVEVVDEGGAVVGTVTFGEAVRIEG